MGQHGKYYREFYVGIASDPNDRLINGHGVTTATPNIYWTSPLQTEYVRSLEKYFLTKGTMGGPGGGDNNTCYIYCYKIASNTRE